MLSQWSPERFELGEGLRWFDNTLHMVDLLRGRLLVTDGVHPSPLCELITIDETLGVAVPVAGRVDCWLAAVGPGIAILHRDGRREWLGRPEERSVVATRMNDGAVDCYGRFWVGSMAIDGTPHAGSLYRLDAHGEVARVLEGLTIANGPAFSRDGETMYLADSSKGEIDRLTIEASSGAILCREPFVRLQPGVASPDGMTVDDENHLWVAVWGINSVHRYRPDGTLERSLTVPASQPASVCLGGPTGRRLFVATAYVGLTRPSKADGALFWLDVEVSGPPGLPAVLT